MNVHYGHLEKAIVEWIVANGNLGRIVALDLETKVLSGKEFLTCETILSISLAWHEAQQLGAKVLVLQKEDKEREVLLLEEFDQTLLEIRPLVIIGYNVGAYDIPLLNLKLRDYRERFFWGIRDAIERSYILDLKHAVRFELAKYSENHSPKILPLAEVVNHARFKHIPLMRTKNLVANSPKTKGKTIYESWKKDTKTFKLYAEGDVKDVMLIFKELFLTPTMTA